MILASSVPVHAQGFAVGVTPPRFELVLKPGAKSRQVLEISNALPLSVSLRMRTADWKFTTGNTVIFEDALAPGSCRPWVAIERRDVVVPGNGSFRYRFEIAVPPDAAEGECRFALMIEGDEQSVKTSGDATVGVLAQIGIVVYAAIGDAAPKLEVVGSRIEVRGGVALPVIDVRNTGNAHGRLSGFLSGKDAAGKDLEFDISTLPILPGETRSLEMTVRPEGNETATISYPITIRGKLEWGDQITPFERLFSG